MLTLTFVTRVHGDTPEPLYPIYDANHWGLIDGTGRVVLEPIFDQIGKSAHGWIPDHWEFRDATPAIDVHLTLWKGDPVTDRVIPVRLEGKFGFATRNGRILAHGQYESIDWRFRDGLVEIRDGDLVGFAGEDGELVIPPRFERVYPFSGEHAFVRFEGRWGVIDRTGRFVVSPVWDEVSYPLATLVSARIGNKWGVLDRSGMIVVPFGFDRVVGSPTAGLLPVQDKGRVFYVHPDGKGTIAFEFVCPGKKHRKSKTHGYGFFTSVAMVKCGERYGLIGSDGGFVLEPEWDHIGIFNEGRAVVRRGNKTGVVDEKGRFVVEPTADLNIAGYAGGLAGFNRMGTSHGFFDLEGNVAFTVSVESASFFEDEVAGRLGIVRQNKKDGYIDDHGKWIIAPRFHKANRFRGPLAFVEQPVSTDILEVGYINRAGEVVYRTRLSGFVYPPHLVDPRGIGP